MSRDGLTGYEPHAPLRAGLCADAREAGVQIRLTPAGRDTASSRTSTTARPESGSCTWKPVSQKTLSGTTRPATDSSAPKQAGPLRPRTCSTLHHAADPAVDASSSPGDTGR